MEDKKVLKNSIISKEERNRRTEKCGRNNKQMVELNSNISIIILNCK